MNIGGRVLEPGIAQVMGILNVTPDSFSDGGRAYKSVDKALKLAEAMLVAGASIIDVGGESTRPGALSVSDEEECERVIPVVERLAKETSAIISIDTSSPMVIRESIRYGAHLINDVRALSRKGALEAVSESSTVSVCLMHMQGEPEYMQDKPRYDHVVDEVKGFLHERVTACADVGIEAGRIILDPGFGFGKSLEHNYELFHDLPAMVAEGYPVLVGVSRKSMIGQLLGRDVNERMAGSISLAVMALTLGASIFRVHDVKETVDALRVAERVLKG